MQEWWEKDLSELCNEEIKYDSFNDIFENSKIYVRSGLKEFLQLMRFWEINVLVVSAGVGDLIEECFRRLDLERSRLSFRDTWRTLKIISNFGVYNQETGKLIDFKKPYVTSVNKSEMIKKNLNPKQRNFILIGDIVLDSKMIEGIEYDNLLKIGFMNNP